MEQQITIPIERAVNGVPNVIARRSRTIFGLSVVELTFSYGTDDYFARQVVLEKLRDADLPEGVTPDLAPLTTPTGELYRYVVDGPGHDEMELRELQDWVITPRFLQAPGVADVNAFGGLVKQYQVEVDPIALEKYGITVGQISKAISANNQNSGGALLDNRQQSLVVRGVGLVRSTADIENIVLAASKGAPVFVRDVARVRIGPALQTGIFGLDSKSGGVEGLVLMRRGENPSEVLEGIKEAVEDLNSDAPARRRAHQAHLRPHRAGEQQPAHGLPHPARRPHRGFPGIAVLPGKLPRGRADGADHSALAAVRVRLHEALRRAGQPAQPGRSGFRHHRGRHAGDGGIHRAAPGSQEKRCAPRST